MATWTAQPNFRRDTDVNISISKDGVEVWRGFVPIAQLQADALGTLAKLVRSIRLQLAPAAPVVVDMSGNSPTTATDAQVDLKLAQLP